MEDVITADQQEQQETLEPEQLEQKSPEENKYVEPSSTLEEPEQQLLSPAEEVEKENEEVEQTELKNDSAEEPGSPHINEKQMNQVSIIA